MTRTFNLADLFEVVANAVPERTAFICGEQRLSYRELDERATRLASALRVRGIGRGDNVGIALHNSAEYLETFLACCKIGAAPANVNYRYVAEELHYLLGTLELRALFYGPDLAGEVGKLAGKLPKLQLQLRVQACTHGAGPNGQDGLAGVEDYETLLASGRLDLPDPERSDNDVYLLCTGGTTGMPKGVMWPHKSLFMGALGGGGIYFRRPPIAQPEELAQIVPHGPALSFFAIAPMMHGAAMWSSLISLYAGHAVVVNDQRHFDAGHIWDLVERGGVNIISVVGDAMALPLVKALEAHPGRWKLDRLMVVGNGGAVLSAQLQERLKAALPHLTLANGMGSSETGMMGSGDKPAQGDGFMVLKARGDLAVLGADLRVLSQPGEQGILARSGYTPIGYYGDAKKSAEVFVTVNDRLWVLSGDQARIDAQGNIVVLGRGSQCINTGGEKVFTEEVEEAVRRYAAVADVLVVGLPDERWGQKVVAVIEVAPGHRFDRAEFQRICREHLSSYKVPKTVVLTERVQRSPAGKADYRWAKDFATRNPSL
ncbi:MAG: AMP-binding protein [Polaromonas sp.]